MSGTPFLRQGGFSHLVIFHRGLGSNHEDAGPAERAERLLYFLPHDMDLSTQLSQLGLFEGLIDFTASFNGEKSWLCVDMHKRTYAMLQIEPQIWMVLAVVKPLTGAAPPEAYARSTDSFSPRTGAVAAAKAGAVASGEGTYAQESLSDAALLGVMQRLYFSYALFFGSLSRVCTHTHVADVARRTAELAERVRVLQEKITRLQANIEHMQGGAPGDGEASEIVSDRVLRMHSDILTHTNAARDAEAQLALMRKYSPIAALRYTLRNVLDFHAHYTDWASIQPWDSVDSVRFHRPFPLTLTHTHAGEAHGAANGHTRVPFDVSAELDGLIASLRQVSPGVDHVAFVYDGIVVHGRSLPGLHALMAYMRNHCFHVMRGSYVPDKRPMYFTMSHAPGEKSATRDAAAAPALIRMPLQLLAVRTAASPSDGSSRDALWRAASRQLSLEESLLAGEQPPWHARISVSAARGVASPVPASTSPRSGPSAFDDSVSRLPEPSAVTATLSSPSYVRYATLPCAPLLDASPAGAGLSRLHRELKPSTLSTPALPGAAAARKHMNAVATVDVEWPVLNWPYVSADYMESLPELLSTSTTAAPGDTAPSYLSRACTATSALGPPTLRRVVASSGPSTGDGIVRSTSTASITGSGRPRAGSASTVTSSASLQVDDSAVIFAPCVFAEGTGAPGPSHRVLWLQAGLLSAFVYVRTESLRPPESCPDATADVWPAALYAVADAVRDVFGPKAASLEAALTASLDASISAARSAGTDAVRHVQLDTLQGLCRVSGFSTLARQGGLGRDSASSVLLSQAPPMPSAAVSAEIPLHLSTALSIADGGLSARAPLLAEAPTLQQPPEPVQLASVDSSGDRTRRVSLRPVDSPAILAHNRFSVAVNAALASSGEAAAKHAQAKLFSKTLELLPPEEAEEYHRAVAAAIAEGSARTLTPPIAEHTMLATRYEGGVTVSRLGGRVTMAVLDPRMTVDPGAAAARSLQLAMI